MRVFALGAGICSSCAALDLADDLVSPDVEVITLADIREERVKELSRRTKLLTTSKEIRTVKVDASDENSLIEVLRGHDIVINGAPYYYIMNVMRAALSAGVNYLDLGSDVETVMMQRKYDLEFRRRGLLAIAGMGGSPGIINILAKKAVLELDKVERILLREGWIDFTDYEALGIELPVPYSFDTIVDELSDPVEVWTAEGVIKVKAFSGEERFRFPDPVGEQYCYYVEHPEVYTLGEYFKSKGVKFVDYKLSFPKDLLSKYRLLKYIGLCDEEKVIHNGREVSLRDIVRGRVLEHMKRLKYIPNDFDVIVARAEGYKYKDDRRTAVEVSAQTKSSTTWRVSAQAMMVGVPASVAAQMICEDVGVTGVRNPEEVFEPDPFLRRVIKRGVKVRLSVSRDI